MKLEVGMYVRTKYGILKCTMLSEEIAIFDNYVDKRNNIKRYYRLS